MKNSHQVIYIIDFGSQFTQLLGRRIRDAGVYCEIIPHNIAQTFLKDKNPNGILLSGSSESVLDNGPTIPSIIFDLKVPVLGFCYGMQAMASYFGGIVKHCDKREFGFADITINKNATNDPLFGLSPPDSDDSSWHVWMSHGDQVMRLPENFKVIASSNSCPYAAMSYPERNLYACQFHAEVTETKMGENLLGNFLTKICHCNCDWSIKTMVDDLLEDIREAVDNHPGDIILGLSGGVDSSVVAVLLSKVVDPIDRLKCILVDHGFLRKGEVENVKDALKKFGNLHLHIIDAKERFLNALKNVEDPEEKRKIIGKLFVEEFENYAISNFKNVTMLAQGTIYPDVIESAGIGNAKLIKTHHNVGGLPEKMSLQLLEPLRNLFKDEVRRVGEDLGLAHEFVYRHPFPGPGLAVRIIGKITPQLIDIVREADHIFMQELINNNYYDQISQAFAAIHSSKAVAVKGDGRVYENILSLRAVVTTDFMTASIPQCLPLSFLQSIARRILNEVPGISRVLYDLTEKPPGTIEYE